MFEKVDELIEEIRSEAWLAMDSPSDPGLQAASKSLRQKMSALERFSPDEAERLREDTKEKWDSYMKLDKWKVATGFVVAAAALLGIIVST